MTYCTQFSRNYAFIRALTLDSEHLEDKAVAIVAKEIKKFAEQEG